MPSPAKGAKNGKYLPDRKKSLRENRNTVKLGKQCHSERSAAESKNPFFTAIRNGSFDFVTQILTNLLHFAQDDTVR